MLLLNSHSSPNKNILVIVNVLSKLDNAYLVFKENPDYSFFAIVLGTYTLQDYYNSRLSKLNNLILNDHKEQLIYKIEKMGMVISTECAPTSLCRYGLRLLALCDALRIPIVELQHGLFQYGLHYSVEPKSYETMYDFLNIDNFTTHLLSFYSVTTEYRHGIVVGFPKYHFKDFHNYNYDAQYILILTNFNWDCFSPEDFDRFLGCIIKTTESHPDIQFLWKPHSAELGYYLNKTINLDAYSNLTVVQSDPLLSLLSLDSLVKNAAKVISTISTVLFDCEAYQKPTAVYKCSANSQLLDEIKSCCTFSNESELKKFIESKEPCRITTGKLIEYDNSKFRKFVEEEYKLTSLSKMEILQQIAKYTSLLEK